MMNQCKQSYQVMLAVCLCVILCVSTSGDIYGANDEPASWAVDEINEARANGLIPEALLSHYADPITRADFCLAIVHLMEVYTELRVAEFIESKALTVPDTSPFTDVDDLNVTYAYILGITGGYPDNTFKPNASITRQEAAKMLTSAFYAFDKQTIAPEKTYNDNGDISDWAKPFVDFVDEYDMMNGVGDNRFDPTGTYQRQMAILTMNRLYNNIGRVQSSDNAFSTPFNYLVYGLGNAEDYTMTYGNSSFKLYSMEHSKNDQLAAIKIATNMYEEIFEMQVYVKDGRDYFAIPELGKMVSYKTGHKATLISEMFDAVHHDLISARISNGEYLYTYGIPFIQDEELLFNYTFHMSDGDIVALDKEFNGTTVNIANIEFTFEALDEATFEIPQDLDHTEHNYVDDGEWAPFWWEIHPE